MRRWLEGLSQSSEHQQRPCEDALCSLQIMVDDAAAIVIMLAPEPKQAAKNLQAPAGACVASVSNAVANSPEAKAARDKLAALPYQNFFRHLQLVRPMSLLKWPSTPDVCTYFAVPLLCHAYSVSATAEYVWAGHWPL